MPKCYLCGTEDEKLFYPDRTKTSGFTNRCYPCDKAYLRKYNKSPERKKYNRDRARRLLRSTLQATAKARQKHQEFYWNHRERILEHLREYRKRPEIAARIKARQALKYALKRREIIKPEYCDDCAKPLPLRGHHHLGYAKENWLNVQWLCDPCHGKVHRI